MRTCELIACVLCSWAGSAAEVPLPGPPPGAATPAPARRAKLLGPVADLARAINKVADGGASGAPITMEAFKIRMMNSYASPGDAFHALLTESLELRGSPGNRTLSLEEFVHGAKTFKPPLTELEATYAFRHIDLDHSARMTRDEFIGAVRRGHFDAKHGAEAHEPITMAAFKTQMLNAYASPRDAFRAMAVDTLDLSAALGNRPMQLSQFVRGSRSFKPPLTEVQAAYAFHGLDADQDGSLTPHEFRKVIDSDHFAGRAPRGGDAPHSPPAAPGASSVAPTTPPAPATATTAAAPGAEHAATATHSTKVPITLAQFKFCMLNAYAAPLQAFEAIGANPSGLAEFVRTAKGFKPPLTEQQAQYAFRGFDEDHDNALTSFEFFEVLEGPHFFMSSKELEKLRSQQVVPTTAGPGTTTAAPRAGFALWPFVAIGTVLCALAAGALMLMRLLVPEEKYSALRPRVTQAEDFSAFPDMPPHQPPATGEAELMRQRGLANGSMEKVLRVFFGCCLRPPDAEQQASLPSARLRRQLAPTSTGGLRCD